MRGDSFGTEYKPIDYKLLKKLFVFLKPYSKYVWLALIITVISSALGPIRPLLAKITIDKYIALHDWNGLLMMIGLIFGLLMIHGAIQFFMTYLMQWVGQKVLYDIRIKLFDHINSMNMSFFDKNPVGRLVTRVTNDVEGLNQLFSQGVVMIIADILLIMWIIGFMFYINWELSILTLSILPLLLIVTTVFRKKVRVLFRDLRLELAKMNSFLNEFISGISTVKLFTQEKKQNEIFDISNDKTKVLNVKTVFYYAVFFPVIELLSAIALAIVIWWAGGNIMSGLMTIGTLVAFLQYAEMFFRPVRDLSEKYTTLQGAMASAERIYELLDTQDYFDKSDGSIVKEKLESTIEIKNLSFAYTEDKPVLKNVNLTIKKGEKIAIVGATGSGKTTLISLLLGFYEYNQGDILIDGVSLRDISRDSLRKMISPVMQDVFLFSRSIEDNISLGDKKIDSEIIKKSAVALGADSFIENLNQGYKTLVNERGSTLSAGQRQLISFCRAFAANPEILILDEATSNIDTETENMINDSLNKLLSGRTSIIIAHRLSTVKKADKIVVFHHGEIREQGTHEELLSMNGIYARLHKLHYRDEISKSA